MTDNTAAKRQVEMRERMLEKGLKTLTIGFVNVDHHAAFKKLAEQSKKGELRLIKNELVRVVLQPEKPPKVVKKQVLIHQKDMIFTAAVGTGCAVSGFLLGLLF